MLKGAQGGRRRSNPHICKSSFSKYLSQWRWHWLPCPVYVVVHVVRVDSKACHIVDQNLPCHIPEWAECWELWFCCCFFSGFLLFTFYSNFLSPLINPLVCVKSGFEKLWNIESNGEEHRWQQIAQNSNLVSIFFLVGLLILVQIEGSRYTKFVLQTDRCHDSCSFHDQLPLSNNIKYLLFLEFSWSTAIEQ